MSSGFNPNKLNDHLMSLLHQNIGSFHLID
jgi:hypothetical protein